MNLPAKYEIHTGDTFRWGGRSFFMFEGMPDVETNLTITSETSTNWSVHIDCDPIWHSIFDFNMTVSKNGSVGGFSKCFFNGALVGNWLLWIDLKSVSENPTLLLNGNLTFIAVNVLLDVYEIEGPFNFYVEQGKYLLDINTVLDVWMFYDSNNRLSLFYDATTGLMLNANYDTENETGAYVIRMDLKESSVGSIFTPKSTSLLFCMDSRKIAMQIEGVDKGL